MGSMKLNLAYPRNGTVKQFDCSEDHIRRGNLYDFRLGQDVDGTLFAPEFEGYVFRLKGGQDKDGFPMLQGVLANARVSLLLKRGAVNFCAYRGKNGERRRKSVRGCIVASDIAVLNAVIVKVGEKPIEGVTDVNTPRRLGPKRASKRRKVEKDGKKIRFKAPNVQRLVTKKAKANRVKKLKARREQIKANVVARREFLHAMGQERMAA